MPISNTLLDLGPSIGQRQSGFIWQLCGPGGEILGEVHPAEQPVVNINLATQASIMRTVRNIVFDPAELADINPFRDRVQPWFILEDGTAWQCGEFLFTDAPRALSSGSAPAPTTLMDGMFAFDVPTDRTFNVAKGGSVYDAMNDVVNLIGANRFNISLTDAIVGNPIAQPINSNWRSVLQQLCGLAQFLPPYFDNSGQLVLRPPDPVSESDDNMKYDQDNARVVTGSGSEDPNILDAPNRHIVVAIGITNGEIVGTADVDSDLPYSIQNRAGLVIPVVHQVPGVIDTATANRMAQNFAQTQAVDYQSVTFNSPIDPRHDVFSLVDFYGTTYRETAWNIPAFPGGQMSHTITRVPVVTS